MASPYTEINPRCRDCPRIKDAYRRAAAFTITIPMLFASFPSLIIPDEEGLRLQQKTIEDSANCPGITEEVILVKKGLPWNRKTVQERVPGCGLSQPPPPCVIPSELVEV